MPAQRLFTLPMVLISCALFAGAQVPNLFVLAPRFLARLGYDEQQIGIVMGAFNAAMLVCVPLVGRLAERFGHRAVLVVGCVIAGLGSVGFEAVDSLAGYTAARAAQGVGFAAVLVGAASYVAEVAPPSRLAQALGISGVLTLASQAVGPLVGELLERLAGFEWVCRAGGLSALAGALVVARLPPVTRPDGALVSVPTSARAVIVATALAGFGFGAVWSFLADYTDRLGIEQVTPFFLAYVVAAISTRIGLGHLPDTLGRKQVAVPALCGHALALALMAGLGASWHLVAIGAVFGFSHGMYYPALQAMIVERGGDARARAIAASTFAFGSGIVLGAFALGAVARAAGYPLIYLIAAAAGACAAAVVAIRA